MDGGTSPSEPVDSGIDVTPSDSGLVTPLVDAGAPPSLPDGSVSPPAPGAPGAVTNLELTNEGANSMSLAWTAAVPGKNAIDHYKIGTRSRSLRRGWFAGVPDGVGVARHEPDIRLPAKRTIHSRDNAT